MRTLPENLSYFLKNGLKDSDDGYDYSSELNRILNSDNCQEILSANEIDKIKAYSESVKKIGEITYYTEGKIKELEKDFFGYGGILGFLGLESSKKPEWPF